MTNYDSRDPLVEAARQFLLAEEQMIKVYVNFEFAMYDDDAKTERAAKKTQVLIKKIAADHGFTVVDTDENLGGAEIEATFSGPKNKIISWLRSRSGDKKSSDDQLLKKYS